MNGTTRAALKHAVDQHRRSLLDGLESGLIDLPDGSCHGTPAAYKRGCRCRTCRGAAARDRRLRRYRGEVHTHNANGYSNGCRCRTCLEAHLERQRQKRMKAKP